MLKTEFAGTSHRETLALKVAAMVGDAGEGGSLQCAAREESLLDDEIYEMIEDWSEAIVSPCVHHNILTSEIRIPIPPSISTSLTSLTLNSLERCRSEERVNITPGIESFQRHSNEEVRCPQKFDTLQTNPDASEKTETVSKNFSKTRPMMSPTPLNVDILTEPVDDDRRGDDIGDMRSDDISDIRGDDDDEGDNTVIVSKLQELVIPKDKPNVGGFGMKSSVLNPLPPTSATCVKYKVHQSPNGVTTISIDPKAEPITLQTPLPIIHHVINLPPRKVNSIKNRRRKAEESASFGKSSRLSQLMMSDYKINVDRPPATNFQTGRTGSPTGFFESKNVIKGNMESMKRKVGSWYRRKVKTPVEQLSIDLGFDSVKFPIKLPFKCNTANGVNGTGTAQVNKINATNGQINKVNSLKGVNRGNSLKGVNRVNSLKGSTEVKRINSLKANAKINYSVDGDIDDLENFRTDQRFVEGLACDQGQNEFEELRRVVKQGGDFCKDLAAVLQERSELEATYAKGLSKLSAKLLKASKEATGSVAHAWQAVAVQIDTQAELHRIWSTALLDEIAKPLRNSTETQHKIRKSVEGLVEKTTRNLAEWRIAEAKAKRQCFSSSKDFEKIQENAPPPASTAVQTVPAPLPGNGPASTGGPLNMSTTNLHSQANSVLAEVKARSRVLSLPPPDKDPIKLEAKRRKAEEAVRRADIEYYTFCVRSERARLEWEGAIRNGSTCLRTLEEEKLALLKELATKYLQHFNDFIPNLLRSSDSLEEPIKTCSVEQDMHSVVDIRRHAGCEQLLPDFYAEDTANLMKKERRMEALQKFLFVIKQDLERERKGASSIEGLSRTLGDTSPKIETAHHDLSDRLYYVKAMLLYLEGARTKIENAVADQEGRQRPNAAITQYMRHQRDKQGLPQTILKVPTWARDECLNHGNSSAADSGSGSAGSVSPDWRETKDHPVVHSTDHDDFDEFSSEGSEHMNEDVFDESLSLPTSPDESVKVKEPPATSDLVAVPIPSIAPSIGQCRAIYDYESNMFDELTIKTGEILNVHDKQDDGWWLGELNGQVGIFPATYVEEILNN